MIQYNKNIGINIKNPTASFHIVGTNSSNNNISFITQNSNFDTSFSIKNNGYIGIGTTNQNTPLHIKVNGVTMSGSWTRVALLESVYPVLAFQSTALNTYGAIGYDSSVGSSMVFWVGATTSNITNNNVEILRLVGTTNRVGILTTSPSFTLDVNGTTNIRNQFSLGSSGDIMRANWDSLGVYFSGVNNGISLGNSLNTRILYISTSSNIGIGTTSPYFKLDIVGGDIKLDNNKSIYYTSSTGSYVSVFRYDSGNNVIINADNTGDVYIRSGNVTSARFTNTSGTVHLGGTSATSEPVLKISTTGVSIGTASNTNRFAIKSLGSTASGNPNLRIYNTHDTLLFSVTDQGHVETSGYLYFSCGLAADPVTNGYAKIRTTYQYIKGQIEFTPNSSMTQSGVPIYMSPNGSMAVGLGSKLPNSNSFAAKEIIIGTVANSIYPLEVIAATAISARFDGRVIGATAINDNEFITLGQLAASAATTYFSQNGNSFGATAVLGTNDNYGLIIETNGNTNITIATSGNVGIGRQAAYKFDVNGIARVGATDSSGQLYIKGATGTGQYIYLDNGLSIWSFVGGSNFSIKENDNVKFTIKTTNGYVGIGTQNPLQALDIVGNIRLGGTANTVILEGVNGYFDVKPVSNIGLVIRESSDTNKYINIGVNPNNYGLIQYRGSLNIGLYQNGSVALLSLTSSSQTDLMIISPTGSIGRTSSSTFLSGNYFAQNGNSFGATAVLGTIDNTSLQFITNNTERMTILNNGDVTFNGNNMRWYNQVSKLGFGLTATQTILGKIHIEGSDAGNGIVLTRNGVTVSFAASPILAGLFMTSNNPLVFYTNNTERLIIAANGNVGIGTSSPTYKLDVNGTIHAYATFSNGTSEVKLLSHATHSIDVVVPAATGNYGIRIGNTSGYGETLIQNRYSGSVKESIFGQQYSDTYVVTSAKDLTPSDAHVRFEINASEKVRFTNNGYVGIGTNNPTQMLHILSATSRIRLDISTSSGESAIVSYNTSGGWLNLSKYGSINTSNTFGITVSGYSVLNSYGSPFIIGNIDNNPILFGTNNAIRSTITGVGDFGINNLAPQEKLHITGNLRLGLNSGDGYYISWGQDTIASTGDFARIKGIRTSAAGNQAGDLVFYTKPSGGGTSPNERLRILSTGQIGINTSNPTASLHVIGSGLFTDTLYASNLYISGTVTTVNSNNVSISDSIIELATGQMGSNPLYDSGIIINRGLGGSGSIANVGFIWQETSDEFALIGTGNTSSSTTITISNYENLRLNNLNSNILNTNSINILSSGTQSDLLVISPTGSVGRTSSISFLMYGLSQSFFAQGGNSFGNTAVIGTNDNNRLQLKTNNITALTIGTSGNVGIGTTTDNGYKLEISSTTGVLFRRIDNYDQSIKVLSSASGNFITFNQANAKNAYITINDALSDAVGSDLYLAASNTITGTSVNNVSGGNLRLRSGLSTGNNGSASIIFETGLLNASGTTIQNYVSRLIISGNGNVGIGTDTPLEKLHVQGSIYLPNNSFLTIGTAYGSGSLYIRNGASNIMEFTSTGLKSYVNFYADGGSVNNVAYGFYNDRDSGMYLAATNSIGFVTTAIERFRISDNGTLNILSLTSSQTDLMIISTTGSIGRTSSSVFLTANYFAQNGNTFGATAVLGTNDAQALQFEVNGNTRIQLQSTSYSTRFFNNDGNYTSITNRIIEFSRTNGSSIGTYIDGNTDNTLLLYARSGFYINQGGNNIQQLTMTENMFKIRNYSTVSNILFNSSTDVNLIKVTDTGNTFIKTTDSTVNSYGIWLQNGSASTIMKSTNDGWIGFGLSQSYMGSGQTFEVRTNTFGISGTNPAIYIYTMGGTSPRIQFGNGVGTVRITDKQDSKNLTFTSDATNFEFYKMNYSSGTQSIHSFSTHSTSNDFAFKYNTNIIAATSAINLKAVVINPTFSSNGMTSINSTILSLEINTASNISSNNYIQVIEGGNTYFTLSRNNGSSLRMAMGNNTTNAELYHNNSGAHITLATTNRTFLNQSQIILNDAISTISNSKLQVVGNAHILTSSTTSGDALLIQNGTNDVLTVRNNNDILISTSLLKSSIVNNMSIGTYTISTFSTTNFQAAFINYYISSGTNSRVGQIMVNYNTAANSLDFTEITSVDIGDTNIVTIYPSINASDIHLNMNVSSGTWSSKVFLNAL